MKITTIGLDLAKNVFQVHGIDTAGAAVVRGALRRGRMLTFFSELEPCLIGMEACGTSHYWARELGQLGHQVKLMPPAYVKPYVKRGKTDAGDAEAICEAVTRPTMRFVAVKSADQQSVVMLHRTRELLVRQRTQLVNMVRGQLAEFGIVLAKGIQHALGFIRRLLDGETLGIPELAVKVVTILALQLQQLQMRIGELEKELKQWFRADPVAQALATIPGVGFITASALASRGMYLTYGTHTTAYQSRPARRAAPRDMGYRASGATTSGGFGKPPGGSRLLLSRGVSHA